MVGRTWRGPISAPSPSLCPSPASLTPTFVRSYDNHPGMTWDRRSGRPRSTVNAQQGIRVRLTRTGDPLAMASVVRDKNVPALILTMYARTQQPGGIVDLRALPEGGTASTTRVEPRVKWDSLHMPIETIVCEASRDQV